MGPGLVAVLAHVAVLARSLFLTLAAVLVLDQAHAPDWVAEAVHSAAQRLRAASLGVEDPVAGPLVLGPPAAAAVHVLCCHVN